MIGGVEVWRPVAGFTGYAVSNRGRVRSFHRGGRVLKTAPDGDGYPMLPLVGCDRRKSVNVHRLVATAFRSSERNALHNEVAHLDGDRTNCHASNLRWVSKRENHSHKRLHGTAQIGEAHPRAKLSAADVANIRARLGPRNAARLAREFGVGATVIKDIRAGRLWRSTEGESPTAAGGDAQTTREGQP